MQHRCSQGLLRFSRDTELKEDRGREWTSPGRICIRREVFVKACGDDTECPPGIAGSLFKAIYVLRETSAALDEMVETQLGRQQLWFGQQESIRCVTWNSLGGTTWCVGRESSNDIQVCSNQTGVSVA